MATSTSGLRGTPGDRLMIRGHRVGDQPRDAEILDALGENGAPPFLVRWEDGSVSRLYPSSDAYVQHFEHEQQAEPAAPGGGDQNEEDWEGAVPPRDS